MKKTLRGLIAGTAALALSAGSAFAEKIVIGHFGNPTPMQIARAEGLFEKATGWDIEWRKFASGAEIIAAMASGDVKISELGSSPTTIAMSQGVDMQMFMLAIVIGKAESLVARDGSGVSNVADLKGKRVAVPIGSTAHFSLMGALQHEKVPVSEVKIMGMPPDQIAAAWEQGAIDAAFVWEPAQSRILKTGKRILGADTTAAWGFPTFDGWVVNKEFAASHAKEMAAFAKVADEANAAYLANPAAWTPTSPQVLTIAKMTGASPEEIPDSMKGYTFVPLAEQLSDKWLGSAPATLKATAEFLKAAGRIEKVADSYAPFVNTSIAKAAVGK
ncbi:taurine ABC transporter substrate-binding protein [Bosea sp. 117]|uniref:taurine ABC transporter substrate-binding protein n=1 Tax=Bosea sp. 117 TaxID=1125973 RepID=UPI00049414EC|nr:taurine ABC transporter substrate-binding protein [Bosea sp. 117]